MTSLTPDRTRTEHGLVIREKIIPWGAVWPRTIYGKGGAVKFSQGSPYKADRLLTNGTGLVRYITIHTTGTIQAPYGTTMAEQYARAVWPDANLSDLRFHYYIDACDCWQLLREDEVGRHIDARSPGNETSLAVALILDGREDRLNRTTEERGALLAALLLGRHGLGIDRLTTHSYWERHKRCPTFTPSHWRAFRQRVADYLAALGRVQADCPSESAAVIRAGDLVTIREGAVYTTGRNIPSPILAQTWRVREAPPGDRVILHENAQGTETIDCPVDPRFLTVVASAVER